MTVYSTRFIALSTTENETVDYTVPQGMVAVVVDVTARAPSNSGGVVQVYLVEPQVELLNVEGPNTGGEISQWRGRFVCDEGETIEALVLASAFASVGVSGYLLSV